MWQTNGLVEACQQQKNSKFGKIYALIQYTNDKLAIVIYARFNIIIIICQRNILQ